MIETCDDLRHQHETRPIQGDALPRRRFCGLALRVFGRSLGVPAFIVKYSGSLLWATMVFLLVAILMRRLRPWQNAAAAMAVAEEWFRLYHAPWLCAFRLTLPGALLLGRIFSACRAPTPSASCSDSC